MTVKGIILGLLLSDPRLNGFDIILTLFKVHLFITRIYTNNII